jgi:hypothetical protein
VWVCDQALVLQLIVTLFFGVAIICNASFIVTKVCVCVRACVCEVGGVVFQADLYVRVTYFT